MDPMQGRSYRVVAGTVAVVDPRPADYAALLEMAPGMEIQVEFLSSGHDALQLARTVGADLWVVHVALPDMSGFDLCTMLRAHAAKSVIYMVTDEYRVEDERAAWTHGASLFGCKPLPASWFADFRLPRRRKASANGTPPGSLHEWLVQRVVRLFAFFSL